MLGAAAYIGRSTSFVTHQFKQYYRCTFLEYVWKRRIEKAKSYLASKTIAETARLSGFKNRYHFSRLFKQVTGISPAQYQKQGKGEVEFLPENGGERRAHSVNQKP